MVVLNAEVKEGTREEKKEREISTNVSEKKEKEINHERSHKDDKKAWI